MRNIPLNNIKTHTILTVDDEKEVLDIIERLLEEEDKVVRFDNLEEAKEYIFNNHVNLLILDYNFPGGTSLELVEEVRATYSSLPIVLITGQDPEDIKLESLEKGVNFFVQKPFKGQEFRAMVRNLLRLSDAYQSLEDANTIIKALTKAVETRDTYTEGHSTRVAEYTLMLYDFVGFNNEEERKAIMVGCLLHDIGKIGVPDSILKSANRLTKEEFDIIKEHSQKGYDICRDVKNLENALPIIKNHHEKLDGTGYPDGLKGDEIPIIVQMVSICDIFDALTSKRAYRNEHGKKAAFDTLKEEAKEGKINKYLTDMFIKMMHNKKILIKEDKLLG